jgi:choline dehydrogenase-like flavoprotein
MKVDGRSLPAARELQADVCIVGAGAAGITLALALAGTSLQVCLLESGGLDADDEPWQLSQGRNVGHNYFPLSAARRRFFGGSTNHWTGVCRPLDPEDLEPVPWMKISGWPISYEDLAGYYPRAQELCEIALRFDTDAWTSGDTGGPLNTKDGPITHAMFLRSPPTRFGEVYREQVLEAPNIHTVINSNVMEFEQPVDSAEITRVRVASLGANQFSVKARVYVLAAGGIENARLLLASNSHRPTGVGNDRNQVGRYFMEHPHLAFGTFLPSDPGLDMSHYAEHEIDDYLGYGLIGISSEVRRKEKMLNFSMTFETAWSEEPSKGVESLKTLRNAYRGGQMPDDLGEHIYNVLTDLDAIGEVIYRRARRRPRPFVYRIFCRTEQEPNPASRVTLDEERDQLGMPRPVLDWQLTELDLHTLQRGQQIVARELGRLGLGRLRIPEAEDRKMWSQYIFGGGHHMGTTRMSDDPSFGVVDRNGRVHGTANLFVAGSSVFSTSGYANPTLTIVALANRLADHIKQELS